MTSSQTNILLIGGTGFIGKVLLERLLVQDQEATVYLLVRPKRGKTPAERFNEFRTLPCFENVQQAFDNDRVRMIPGDTCEPGLGLKTEDRYMLTTRITHILSLAACIDFDLPMETAANANTKSALSILDLAKECDQLGAFVHCSTAYVMLPEKGNAPIPEEHVHTFSGGRATRVYDRIIRRGVSKREEEGLLQQSGYPNTYNYTKALTETLLVERKGSVPLVIVRPSIVTACLQYPRPGWIDSRAALAAFIAMYGTGFLHTIPGNANVKLDVVPCDYVANRMVYAAFGQFDRTSKARVIHATAGLEHSMTVGEIVQTFQTFFKPKSRRTQQRPFLRIMSDSSDPRVAKSFAKDKRRVLKLKFMAKLLRQKKVASSLDKVATALDKIQEVFSFFTHNTFDFQSEETIEDVMPGFEKEEFMDVVHLGIYHYLLRGEETPEDSAYLKSMDSTTRTSLSESVTETEVNRLSSPVGRRVSSVVYYVDV